MKKLLLFQVLFLMLGGVVAQEPTANENSQDSGENLTISDSDALDGNFLTPPYLQNVTASSVTVMWESTSNLPGVVNYGATETSGWSVSSKVVNTNTNTFIHKAVLSSLEEATVYFYQVYCNGSSYTEQSFKTATTDVNASFSVGIWGDSHYVNPFSKMASYMVNNLNVDFCFTSGDLSNLGYDHADLATVFIPKVLGTIGSKVPFYVSFGNHDVSEQVNNNDLIRKYVAQPAVYNSDPSKISGSFAYVYGNSVFISIDWARYSTDLVPNGWLENFLKSPVSQQAKFRFIFIHCPPFFERWQLAEMGIVKNNIPSLCEKYGVSAVFSGHMHGYERGLLNGVQYITQGGGSYMDVNEPVGPTIYPHIVVGTNKPNAPANFNNGLTNHVLTLEITPTKAISKLHYFDGSGNYKGVIEAVEMAPRGNASDVNSMSTEPEFSIREGYTQKTYKIESPEKVDVTVFNLQGKEVVCRPNMPPVADLDLSDLTQGVYLVRLKAGKKEFSKTILVSTAN